jgi:hypothetical protein
MPIIHQYLTLPKSILRPPGLGDFLRGTIALYQYASKRKIPLYVTFDGHPIGEYLVKMSHPTLTTPVVEMINNGPQKNPMTLQQLEVALDHYDLKKQTITLCTNAFPDTTPSPSVSPPCQQFMRSLLTPLPAMKNTIDEVMRDIGLVSGEYDVIHLRSGDPSFMTQNLKSHSYNSLILSRFTSELTKTEAVKSGTPNESVMLSDNLWIKNQVVTDFPWIKCLATEPTHLGSVIRSNQPLSRVFDTLIDFFVISLSRRITQFSVYNWGSGFSDICHHIYGQPIDHIYLKL